MAISCTQEVMLEKIRQIKNVKFLCTAGACSLENIHCVMVKISLNSLNQMTLRWLGRTFPLISDAMFPIMITEPLENTHTVISREINLE